MTATGENRWPPPGRNRWPLTPCGVLVDGRRLWVADTFHHRLVAFTHAGREICEYPGYGWEPGRFAYPTSLARWHDFLLVADAEARRIQAFLVRDDDDERAHLIPLSGEGLGSGELAKPWIAHPFGMSVNHNGRLAVADRLRRCVWLVDLPAVSSGWDGR